MEAISPSFSFPPHASRLKMPEIVPGGRIAVIGSYVLTGFFEMTGVLGSFQGNFGDALPIFSLASRLTVHPASTYVLTWSPGFTSGKESGEGGVP